LDKATVVSELLDEVFEDELREVLNRDIEATARIDTLRGELSSLLVIIEKYVTSGMDFSITCEDINGDIVDIMLLDGLSKKDISYFAQKEYNLKERVSETNGYYYLKELKNITEKIINARFISIKLLFDLIALNMSYILTQKGSFKVQ